MNSKVVDVLMEAQLDVLKEEDCSLFGKTALVNTSIEICVGAKTKFPVFQKFIRKSSTKGRVYFEKAGFYKKIVEDHPDPDVGFYIGGKDSCQGLS